MTRLIDLHVHPPVEAVIEGVFGPFLPSLEATFRRKFPVMSPEQIADYYRSLDGKAVLLGLDAQTATGLRPFSNTEVADIVAAHPDVFVGFGSVDPHKGAAAVMAVSEAATLGLKGLKLHPSLQRFSPNDVAFFPLYEEAANYGLILLFHTGVTALGAGMPGGAGIRHRHSHPLLLDELAASFPQLSIVMAHAGVPWHTDAIAIASHKPNVYLDLSGWSPRRFPPELIDAIKGPLRRQALFGSDFPFITPDRWIKAWDEWGVEPEITSDVLAGNAARLLDLDQ